jgi:hypothetical protein
MTLKRKRPVNKKDNGSNKRHKVSRFRASANAKFQSFSERIENLNIDVLRKVRAVIPNSGDDEEDTYVHMH